MRLCRYCLPVVALAITATAAAAQDQAQLNRCQSTDLTAQDPNRSMQDPSRQKQDSAVAPAATTSRQPARDSAPIQSFVEQRLCQALAGISLTADQRARLDIVRERFITRLAGITSDTALTDEQRRTLGEYDLEIRNVLTPEQHAAWDRNVARIRSRRN